MKSTNASVASDKQDAELFVTDTVDDARYLLMRIIRLVAVLLAEYWAVHSLLLWIRTAMWLFLNSFGTKMESQTGSFLADAAVNYPWPSLLAWTLVFSVCWITFYSMGLPYRFNTKKPGLNARRCHRCKIAIPGDVRCSNCKAWRPVWLVEMLLLVASGVVSVLFAIHDGLMVVLSFAMAGKS